MREGWAAGVLGMRRTKRRDEARAVPRRDQGGTSACYEMIERGVPGIAMAASAER